MADVYDQVQAVIEQRLMTYPTLPKMADNTTPAVQFENVKFDPPTSRPWWRTSFIPVGAVRGSFGSNGYTRLDGQFNIDFFYPAGTGSGEARRAVDGVLAYFKSGTQLVSDDGVEVSIRRAWRVATLNEPDWYHIQGRVVWVTYTPDL